MPNQQESSLEMRRVSNSEVSAWLTCERQYYYEYDLKLEPIKKSDTLNTGILGHEILADYYERRQNGESHTSAASNARIKLQGYLASHGMFAFQIVLTVDRLLSGYWELYASDNWTILAVEKEYTVPLTDDFEYVMKLDLLVRDNDTGETLLVDHKFVYDFYSEDAMQLNPQFPKYMGALRFAGIPVNKAILNQIRFREMKNPSTEQVYKRSPYKPSKAKVENAVREQIISSRRIWNHRQLSLQERAATSVRILNKQICRSCSVKDLCLSEFDGGDITYLVQNDYKRNTYGYNPGDYEGMSQL